MKRRHFLGTSIASTFALTTSPILSGIYQAKKQKTFRVVHVSDLHVFPSEKIEKSLDTMVSKINMLAEKPDFILCTGDNIMDSLKHSKEEVEKQWNAWEDYFRSKITFPFYSCIGNHDIWGWELKDITIKNDPLYAKEWAVKKTEQPNRYYSFEHKNWKMICLDSNLLADNSQSYTAQLDDEQIDWLESELKNTDPNVFICLASHVPVLSTAVFFSGDNAKESEWIIPGGAMHIDAKKIKDLLYKNSNVKVALSGHLHLADKSSYLGVNYQCNGAVSGAWWKGDWQEFAPAFAVVDFFSDGSIETELIEYLL